MKISTIFVLALFISALILFGDYANNKVNDRMELGDIEISSLQFKEITGQMPEGYYRICSLKQEDGNTPCVTMLKRSLE